MGAPETSTPSRCPLAIAATFALLLLTAAAQAQYASPDTCEVCHQKIAETYRQTGMGRSFYRPSVTNTVDTTTTYYHQPSDSYFTILRRDGKFYQRRYQLGTDGKPVNVMEKQIDYIMGSGNHARAYLHRTPRNTLIELPLAWYSEKGGYWAMNPGYDRPDHDGFRRTISYDCMFCHNGYPRVPNANEQPFAEAVYSGPLPEGIDCQRCHGPGARHVQLAKTAGTTLDALRQAIVNPARLNPDRQAEVCIQCHLETTSFLLPNAIRRYDRGPFSYQPGQPLADFLLSFDHAPGSGRENKFEIVNAVYRLRQSACFLKSSGKLTCTTCHNPHDIPRGEAATRHYDAVCRECHAAPFDRLVASQKHPATTGCVDCHMPKRRTEDVVHSAATDHYIQRHKPAGDLLADIAERHDTEANAYRGRVALYYPAALPPSPANDLDVAVAQVIEKSNLREGIPQLTAAIAKHSPTRSDYYVRLAEALRDDGQLPKALPVFREAVRRDPKSAVNLQKLGSALRRSGQYAESVDTLRKSTALDPQDAKTWHELGLSYRALGKTPDALAALERAIVLDPDLADAYNNAGVIWSAEGQRNKAEAAFRKAIQLQPELAAAHGNLGTLLSAAGNSPEARYHFAISLRLHPDDPATRYNYALVLGRLRDYDAAQSELEQALKGDPALVDAHELLANLLIAKGQPHSALPHYREMLRLQPESGKAHLGLGIALATTGDVNGALPHLQKAAADPDPNLRDQALQVLRQLGK